MTELIQIAITKSRLRVIEMNSCYSCKHYGSYKEVESYEMPHIFYYIYSCKARPANANLIQFPFKNTKCKQFSKIITPLTSADYEQMLC